nr:acyltransferase family protein [Luteimonas sp. MC1572]
MKYRPDIDGLRAVAVMAVVLHHLSSRFVPGGYVGVDVFFVISGYLITKIISREMVDGTFTFARFYERRIRRIFPALFAVLVAVLIAGYFILLPSDYLATFRGALGTVLFSANIVFWRDLMEGYFAADAKLNPLLHMWSLGVEEQFYLIFPLLLLLCFKYLKGRVLPVLLLASVASLLAAQFLLSDKSVAVFFLLPFRAWELMAGAILAVVAVPQLRARWLMEALTFAGLMAILVPVFAYDADTAFPAMAAVPPVLGAAILIYVGACGSTWVGRLLQLRPVVYLGLISYSLYLWHWPLIVFTRFGTSLEPLTPWIPALLVASLLVASASYHFIEQPFRRMGRGSSRRLVIGVGAAATVVIAAVSLTGVVNRGAESRFSPSVVAIDRVRTAPIPFKACGSRIGGHPVDLCVIGKTSKQPDLLLWGDSHMLAWLPAFDEALRRSGRAALVAANSTCPPLLEVANAVNPACIGQNLEVLAALKAQTEVRTVVMAGFWSEYFSESVPRLSLNGEGRNEEVAPLALSNTLMTMKSLGKQVLVLGPVPTYAKNMAIALAQNHMMGRDSMKELSLRQVQAANGNFYRTVESEISPHVKFVDVAAWFCRPDCVIYRDGISVYRDSNHLSEGGPCCLFPSLQASLAPRSNMVM